MRYVPKYGNVPASHSDETDPSSRNYCYVARDGTVAIFGAFSGDYLNSLRVAGSIDEDIRKSCSSIGYKSFSSIDANGLRLFMYRKDVEAILGIPDAMRDEVAKYQEWYTRPLTAEEQDDVRAYRWHPEGFDYSKLLAEETILVQIEYQDSIVQSFYVSRFTGL